MVDKVYSFLMTIGFLLLIVGICTAPLKLAQYVFRRDPAIGLAAFVLAWGLYIFLFRVLVLNSTFHIDKTLIAGMGVFVVGVMVQIRGMYLLAVQHKSPMLGVGIGVSVLGTLLALSLGILSVFIS